MCRLPEGWPTHGAITAESLVVRYRPDMEPVLDGLSFTVEGTPLPPRLLSYAPFPCSNDVVNTPCWRVVLHLVNPLSNSLVTDLSVLRAPLRCLDDNYPA